MKNHEYKYFSDKIWEEKGMKEMIIPSQNGGGGLSCCERRNEHFKHLI